MNFRLATASRRRGREAVVGKRRRHWQELRWGKRLLAGARTAHGLLAASARRKSSRVTPAPPGALGRARPNRRIMHMAEERLTILPRGVPFAHVSKGEYYLRT